MCFSLIVMLTRKIAVGSLSRHSRKADENTYQESYDHLYLSIQLDGVVDCDLRSCDAFIESKS